MSLLVCVPLKYSTEHLSPWPNGFHSFVFCLTLMIYSFTVIVKAEEIKLYTEVAGDGDDTFCAIDLLKNRHVPS